MKIGVLSDCRMPTKPAGGHGLGRLAWDLAAGLQKRGHHVTLYAGPGSDTPDGCKLVVDKDEIERVKLMPHERLDFWGDDAYLDLSHVHELSKVHPALPVVNWIVDLECEYQPPRAVVGNTWQQIEFPAAKIVPLGIDVDAIPFVDVPTPKLGRYVKEAMYFAFCHKLHVGKGYDLALEVGKQTQTPVHFVGEKFGVGEIPNYHGEINDDAALYEFLGHAAALLSPCRQDAGGRVNLESAACGTPVLTLDWTGTACHVEHCVSGFVCRDLNELIDAAQDVGALDRAKARAWVRETHDSRVMLDAMEALLTAARDGEVW
jgi:glycosyltransferase involved in cell wall biosynthesis